MSDNKENGKNNSISLADLEKELSLKETMRKQLETAFQQVLGQINCLDMLIKRVKNEDKKEEKEKNDGGVPF